MRHDTWINQGVSKSGVQKGILYNPPSADFKTPAVGNLLGIEGDGGVVKPNVIESASVDADDADQIVRNDSTKQDDAPSPAATIASMARVNDPDLVQPFEAEEGSKWVSPFKAELTEYSVRDAFNAMIPQAPYGMPESPVARPWVREVWIDPKALIVEMAGKCYKIGYSVSDGAITFDAEGATEVKQSWVETK